MSLDDARKRKACQSCTKAKAKCSPFEDRLDLCYRCQRLKKECVFDESVRKRGPKNRSRIRQLEQRVGTLIDLLATNGQTNNNLDLTKASDCPATVPSNDAEPAQVNDSTRPSAPYVTPVHTPVERQSQPFKAFDPVEAGLIEQRSSESCLQEFKDAFAISFPFVVIPHNVDAKTLRETQPFLFHAVLLVTSYKNIGLQKTLADEFKEQISLRIIKYSHKGLELLQAVLLYTAWYHFFYNPIEQQMAIMLQLCVAMVQDLGLSRNPRGKARKIILGEYGHRPTHEQSLAEKRAFLGTYYLTAAFSQAGGRRGTLSHTRYMTQCCQQLAERQEYASDSLVTPLVNMAELMCRINDYFSYDDIDNAEVKGESLIQLSTVSFQSELDRLVESIPAPLKDRYVSLQLNICLINMWIYECAVHTSLWNSSPKNTTVPISAIRLRLLRRCLNAMKSYLSTVNAIQQSSFHHLSFPAWSGWCYAAVLACKLVFLEENERENKTEIDPTVTEIHRLVMDESLRSLPKDPCSLPVETVPSTWNPVSVAKEADVLNLFSQMYKRMEFTLPENIDELKGEHCHADPLTRISFFQRNLLHSFTKRMNEHIAKSSNSTKTSDSDNNAMRTSQGEQWIAPQTQYARQRLTAVPIPLMQNLHFNTIDFDSIAPPDVSMSQDDSFADWLWNTAMDDFTIPPI